MWPKNPACILPDAVLPSPYTRYTPRSSGSCGVWAKANARDKRIEIGLTYIYGIGRKSAKDILAQTGINPDTRVKDLTEAEEAKLREAP